MKKIIYSLVIMIAAGSLFTSCLEYVEPAGIQQLRAAKADYLDALATLRLADAELQKANATYVNARAAYVDAQTEWQLIENRIHEYDVQIKAARTEYEVDSLTKLKELLQVQHDTGMANARAALAWAQENLRVTLRDIAAVQNLFTAGERTVFADVLGRY
jgi:predicted  nucleic acid-binding Zn-ribbon protein